MNKLQKKFKDFFDDKLRNLVGSTVVLLISESIGAFCYRTGLKEGLKAESKSKSVVF
jgi:hypothetical protein